MMRPAASIVNESGSSSSLDVRRQRRFGGQRQLRGQRDSAANDVRRFGD